MRLARSRRRLAGRLDPRHFQPEEHCLTCAQRIELLRRGRLDCANADHLDIVRRFGRVIEERDNARAQLAAANSRIEYLESRLRHPTQNWAA